MFYDSIFLNDLQARLYGKISDDDLKTVMMAASDVLSKYDITQKQTALAVYDGLPECFKVYLVSKKIAGRSKDTLYLYKIYLTDFLEVVRKPVEEITANDIRLYLYEVKDRRNITDVSLDSRRRVINAFFLWLHNEGYIAKNPCLQIQTIKCEQKPREPFTDTQMEEIRESCVTDRDKAVVEMLYSTGCRVSELSNLKISDIDFKTREVKLFGKGKKHRTSYLNARAEVALLKYLENRKGDSEYVFIASKKPYNRLGKITIEKNVRDIGVRAGIDKVIPHRFRHTTATDALNRGMSVAELQSILGHEKLDTTMIYAKLSGSSVSYSHHKCII